MSAPKPTSFTCPTCGAPLHPTAGQTEITCEFCGNTVIVPESLRTPTSPPTPPASPQTPAEINVLAAVEMLREVAQEERAHQFAPTALPVVPQTRRRRGGCCGCLSTLFGLLITLIVFGAIGLGIYASSNPQGVAALLADPGKAVNSFIAQIRSGSLFGGPQFTSYSGPPSIVSNGTSVTVRWTTNGADVRLETLNRAGVVTQTTGNLGPSGSHTIIVQGSPGDVLSYRLVASLNGQTISHSFSITIR